MLILAVLVLFSGCVQPQALPETKLSYEISGCQEEQTRSSEVRKAENLDEPLLAVEGKFITVRHSLDYVCCAKMEVEWKQEGNLIELTEINKGEICRCLCRYGVDAKIGPLESNLYLIRIYGVKYQEQEPNLLSEKEVEIV